MPVAFNKTQAMSTALTPVMAALLLFAAAASLSAQSTPAELAEREALQREEQKLMLRSQLNEAQSAQGQKHWEEAARLCEEAYDLTQKVGAGVESETQQAVMGIATTRLKLATLAEAHGDLEGCGAHLNRVLNVDPKNAEALAFKERNDMAIEAMRPMTPNPEVVAQIPEVREEKIKLAKMVQDSRLFLEMGKLDEAQSNLVQVIKADPSNKSAFYYLNLVAERKAQEAGRKYCTIASRVLNGK